MSTKKRIWKYWKYIVLYIYFIFSKSLSLIDLITDLILLQKAIKYQYIELTVVLFLSILAPYIISYSSGVKLFLFRRTFDSFRGFEKWLMILYILPTGIFYFILLDIIDITFQIYRIIGYILLNKTHCDLKESEETLAEQLGMNRMNYEGFKRQKTVGQLFFETLPQCTLQALLFFDIMPGRETSKITQKDLLISIIAAIVNSIGQIMRLYWESRAVHESVLQYALNCIVGRVGWIPYLNQLKIIQNDTSSNQHKMDRRRSYDKQQNIDDEIEIFVDYNIEYNIPIATRCIGYKGKLEFDFSTVTISHFIAALNMMSLKNENDENENIKVKNIKLVINFSTALRFLSIHDIILLLNVCSERNIILPDIDGLIDWRQSILFSIKHGKDISNITHARVDNEPILNAIYKSGYDPDKKILISLLKYSDIDINLTNEAGESIIHLLIKNKDYKGLLLIFKYCNKKNINVNMNYYDIKGYSPLYLALNQYHDEKKQKEKEKEKNEKKDGKRTAVKTSKIKFKKYLYEMLILYGNAHSNFPVNNDGLSPLAFVLINLKDFELALKLCNDYKARLQSYEITILPSLFSQFIITNKYLDIILNICQQCYIDLDGIKDENGNNPLHFLIKNVGWTQKQSIKKSFLTLLKYLLPLKDNNWLRQKNNGNVEEKEEAQYPISLAFSENILQIDTIQCLIEHDVSIKKYCIDNHTQCIINAVQDLVTFRHQFNNNNNNNEDSMEIDVLNQYNITLKAIFDTFMTDNIIKEKLIDSCLDLQLVQQLEYLCNDLQCNLSSMQQQRLQTLKEQQSSEKWLIPRELREKIIRQKQEEDANQYDDDDDDDDDDDSKYSDNDEDDIDLESIGSSNDVIKTVKTVKLVDDKHDDNNKDNSNVSRLQKVNWVELVYGLTVESLSSLDLITDAIVLIELYRAKHVVWTTLMVLATICPYLVSYSVLITLFQKKNSNKNVSSFIRFCVGIFFMTPVCIIYFLLIDVTFMFYVILSTLFFIISCGYIDIKDFIDDYIFKKMFSLSRMQIIGYRRLRTLSQLTFETIPQIFLQLRILQESQTEVTGVDTTNLMISIGIAIFHLLFEALIINLDSRACYLSFYHYSIICLGARLQWIPYSHLFYSINNKMMKLKIYNYESIKSKTCGIDYNVDYIFTNESLRNLAEQLTVLPSNIPEQFKISKHSINKLDNLWIIKLGQHCCKDIDLYSITDLLRACNGRINIDTSTMDWYNIIFTNTDIRNLSFSAANLSSIIKTFLLCGDFNVTTYLFDARMGGRYNVNYVKALMIRSGRLIALRNFYNGLILFGLDTTSREFIFYIMYYRLKLSLKLNDKSYLKCAFMILWYSSRAIFHDNTYLKSDKIKTNCNVLSHFDSIQENEDDNDFDIGVDNIERGFDAKKQNQIDFNFQINTVEVNSINSKKDSMKRFFSQTILRYFENKKFQLIINDGNIESALKLSFNLAECFMSFHDQIEIFLLTLFDDIIEKTKGNNINIKTKFNRDNNIYILIYNDYDHLNDDDHGNDKIIKEMMEKSQYKDEVNNENEEILSAQCMTQKHIDLLEYITSTPTKKIKLSSQDIEMMIEMDGLLRKKWKMFHEYEKYIFLLKDWYQSFRAKKQEFEMIHIRPDENRIIFDIQIPSTIGLETIRITFNEIMFKTNEENPDYKQNKKGNSDKIIGILYLDISPIWTLKKQKGMIHPKHYDTIRWNKIILNKITKQQLMRNKKKLIIDLSTDEIFNFNPSISEITLKMELCSDSNEHIMCNTVSVALSYFVTEYEYLYHEEAFEWNKRNILQRIPTTISPNMELKNKKISNESKNINCCCSKSSVLSDVEMEKELKKRVAQSKREERLRKTILLMGTSNCGKQTFIKQFNQIHGEGFINHDIEYIYKPMIYKTIKNNIISLINAMKELKLNNDITNEEIKIAMDYILKYYDDDDDDDKEEKKEEEICSFDEMYGNHIKILWNSSEIKLAFDKRNVFNNNIDDCCQYFFDDIDRIKQKDYIPNTSDILLVHNKMIDEEIREISFNVNGTLFKVINTGNNRKQWIHFILEENLTAMIFIASLISYDKISEIDENENGMQESIQLFKELINRKEFQNVAIILFLNKKDLFSEKIRKVAITISFPDYGGQPDNFDDSLYFIREQFMAQNLSHNKSIYTHITCAIDQNNVMKVFNDITHIVVNQSLMSSGLM